MAFVHTNRVSSPALFGLFAAALLFCAVSGDKRVPAIYVFGDSTADVGNNNYLPGNAGKANFPYNGIDFPAKRSTGRFSNGYNGIDFLAMHMGLRRSPPPFLSISSKIHHLIARGFRGVNFASAGSGILDLTGSTISLTNQIQNFATVRSNMTDTQADQSLSKSIFLISTGGNDIFDFISQNNAPNVTEKEQFTAVLISNFNQHIEKLYSMGARKFGIIDVPLIGCCPFSRSLNSTGGCVDVLIELPLQFNKAAKVLMHDLSLTLKGMKYSIGSSYEVLSNVIRNPSAFGFKDAETACCGSGKFNGQFACTPNATCCSDRDPYLFWDFLHPTQAASKIAGIVIYDGSTQFASPINFKQLVEEEH